MLLKTIALQNFRNFQKKEFIFSGQTTVIVGPNTSGKTNILEAINLLSSGKSFHALREEEMIKNGEAVARVVGKVTPVTSMNPVTTDEVALEVVLTRGELHGARVLKKKLIVNGVAKWLYNFAGILRTVLFGPWDLGLVTESPSTRRKFLDNVLFQVNREYRRSLLSYERGLRQRNKILEKIRDEGANPAQLLFWNQLLLKNGADISQKREELISFVNLTAPLATGPDGPLARGEQQITLAYDKSIISPARLEKYAQEEVASATTLVGPHRDDFKFIGRAGSTSRTGRDLSTFGSRGEQRMAVLWLKLAELAFVEGKAGTKPVLLLDDIFSELDHRHREIVMAVVGQQQTIITTADPHTIEKWQAAAQVIEL